MGNDLFSVIGRILTALSLSSAPRQRKFYTILAIDINLLLCYICFVFCTPLSAHLPNSPIPSLQLKHPVSPIIATHPKNPPVSPIIATHPKNPPVSPLLATHFSILLQFLVMVNLQPPRHSPPADASRRSTTRTTASCSRNRFPFAAGCAKRSTAASASSSIRKPPPPSSPSPATSPRPQKCSSLQTASPAAAPPRPSAIHMESSVSKPPSPSAHAPATTISPGSSSSTTSSTGGPAASEQTAF